MAKKKSDPKFIQKAIKHPGALTRKAKAAGKTISSYCAGGNLSAQSQRQCNFAKTLKGLPRATGPRKKK
jgi:hypothetical protein